MLIALSGFMGCGKSSVAQELAKLWGCFYFDLDRTIEQEEGRGIEEIFDSDGENMFRILEYECLSRIISDFEDFPSERIVIALGGGTLLTGQCARLIKEKATCIYLRLDVDNLVSNLLESGIQSRPLLRPKTAAYSVSTSAEPENESIFSRTSVRALRGTVAELLSSRREIYESAADAVIDADGLSPLEIALVIDGILSK